MLAPFTEITMRHVFAFAFSNLLAGHGVLAEPADAAFPGNAQTTNEQPKKCDRMEWHEKPLVTLKSDLKLDTSQATDWTEWMSQKK